ncbi:MAG: lysostaphin resistance A-like protein [Traorella sp.]
MNQKLDHVISSSRITFLIFNYFIGYVFLYPYLLVTISEIFNLNNMQYEILTLLIYLFMIASSILVGYPIIKESVQKMPKVYKLIESILLIFVVIYFVSGFTSALITLISGLDSSENQSQIIQAFNQNPLIITFTTIIYAPIVEEMVFRGAIFRGLRSKTSFFLAALISGLMFGFIHVFDSLLLGNFQDLWFLITYASLGFVFCYAYEKNQTIFAPMILHFMNNFLGIIGILISSLIA